MNDLTFDDICLPDFLPHGGFIDHVHGFILFDNPFQIHFTLDGGPERYDHDRIIRKVCRLLNAGAQTIIFSCTMPDDKTEYVYLNRMFLTL